MTLWKSLVLSGTLLSAGSLAPAQISVGVGIGAAPVCPYGYFDYAPYSCAPYGYYGPDWFNGGIFIGAGPWFHGPRGFYGHVDNRYDPRHGYHGHEPGGEHNPEAHGSFGGGHGGGGERGGGGRR